MKTLAANSLAYAVRGRRRARGGSMRCWTRRAAPAEFAADAMIRIAGLDQLEKARRVELLEQAFQKASGAQQPYKRRATFLRLGSTSGFLNQAYARTSMPCRCALRPSMRSFRWMAKRPGLCSSRRRPEYSQAESRRTS